jgi:hypothetical protein
MKSQKVLNSQLRARQNSCVAKKIIAEIGKTKADAQKPESPQHSSLYESQFAAKVREAVFCGTAGKDAIHDVQEKGWKEAIAAETRHSKKLKAGW